MKFRRMKKRRQLSRKHVKFNKATQFVSPLFRVPTTPTLKFVNRAHYFSGSADFQFGKGRYDDVGHVVNFDSVGIDQIYASLMMQYSKILLNKIVYKVYGFKGAIYTTVNDIPGYVVMPKSYDSMDIKCAIIPPNVDGKFQKLSTEALSNNIPYKNLKRAYMKHVLYLKCPKAIEFATGFLEHKTVAGLIKAFSTTAIPSNMSFIPRIVGKFEKADTKNAFLYKINYKISVACHFTVSGRRLDPQYNPVK